MSNLREYIDKFNANDNEHIKTYIGNDRAYDFVYENFPRLSCPDKTIEETFAFRSWTFRKHVKPTPDGYILTEFLPDVSWAGKYNSINAALCHHLNEARWLKNSKIGLDLIDFFLDEKGSSYKYSTPALYEMYRFYKLTGNEKLLFERLGKFERYVKTFEKNHLLQCGLFRSQGCYDAMEFSISGVRQGSTEEMWGIRPTMNAEMYGAYTTLAQIFEDCGDLKKACAYRNRAAELKEKFISACYAEDFFKAVHLPLNRLENGATYKDILPECNVKEEIGYIPFIYDCYISGQEKCFKYLFDTNVFQSEYGITTAERSTPRFLYKVDHECLWNGYIWPYATSQTITAMINLLNKGCCDEYINNERLYELIETYAKTHYLTENGKTVNWIDEVLSPSDGRWYSRDVLRAWGWQAFRGGYERGKDYNHSTFIDLVICGLLGVKTDRERLTIEPRIQKRWDWFALENLSYRGGVYNVYYDKTGEKFGKGKGVIAERVSK